MDDGIAIVAVTIEDVGAEIVAPITLGTGTDLPYKYWGQLTPQSSQLLLLIV
jgi:hypothetical protein